jgi:hypothetical protein
VTPIQIVGHADGRVSELLLDPLDWASSLQRETGVCVPHAMDRHSLLQVSELERGFEIFVHLVEPRSDRGGGRLEMTLQSELHTPTSKEIALPAAPHEMDSLRSRLATLVATALHRRVIDAPRFNELAESVGVDEADRERLLAITATHSQYEPEHESSRPITEASALQEKKLS